MPNPTRISDLPLTNPQGGDFLPIARTTGLFPGTFKILVDQIISTLLNTANTPTINLTLNTATRTLSAEAVLIPLNRGGTGATTAPEARNNLGIGPFGTLTPPVPILSGGTGLTTTPTNGQLLIGNGSGYTQTTITPGSGITIENGPGSIKINVTNLQTAKAWASIWFRENNSTVPRVESSFNIGALVYRGSSYNDGTTPNDNYDVLFTSPLQNNNYVVLLHGSDGQTGGYYPPSGPQINAGGGSTEGDNIGVSFITPATTRTAGTGTLATFTSGFQLTMVATYYYPTHAYLVVF